MSISLSLMHTHKSALTRSVLFSPCSEHFNIHRCSYEALRLWQHLCYVYTAFLSIAGSPIFLVWWTASKGALSSLCTGKDIFILSRIRGFTIHVGSEWCQASEKWCKSIFHGILRTIWHPCTPLFLKKEEKRTRGWVRVCGQVGVWRLWTRNRMGESEDAERQWRAGR